MRVSLLAVGRRMPAWVKDAFDAYAGRMPRECTLELVEIAPGTRTASADPVRAVEQEGKRILERLPPGALVVALDERGRMFDTRGLARALRGWIDDARDVAMVIGGADGLADTVTARAELRWSLSSLTLPHGLVRVIVAEQLYRAWSILDNHPYHRE